MIDLYSVKPVDVETLRAAAEATGRFVVAEDHWPEGGLGETVLSAFADSDESPKVVHLAVREMPGSGKPAELLEGRRDRRGPHRSRRAQARRRSRRVRLRKDPNLPTRVGRSPPATRDERIDLLVTSLCRVCAESPRLYA